ncbi:hypothetical protein L2E82_40417 [Cichorium intybus]|uniref:Uncharacterized protein n=1 Tax=Cichorium intybus TaxID=13427 RepID=A0ACB9AKQ9_CICIN|nr:hypothetical protein L2E82_40417 [Cichorium intybus]
MLHLMPTFLRLQQGGLYKKKETCLLKLETSCSTTLQASLSSWMVYSIVFCLAGKVYSNMNEKMNHGIEYDEDVDLT